MNVKLCCTNKIKICQITTNDSNFYSDIIKLLNEARSKAYRTVNSLMVETYWKIGERIVEEEQNDKDRAEYGDYIIVNLSKHLTDLFGKGFSVANLKNFRRFYLVCPELATHCVPNLSWSNIRTIIRISNPDERNFYLKEAANEN